jgi:allantoicase
MVDLAAALHGADVIGCSDMFYSSRNNLIMPGDAHHMGEGWETKRRRDDGHDWVLVQLAGAGKIRQAVIDTSHFKGNAPRSVMIEGCRVPLPTSCEDIPNDKENLWRPILPEVNLRPNTKHVFIQELVDHAPVSVARVHIYPDGGLARLRLFGDMNSGELEQLGTKWLNALPPTQAREELLYCCGSTRWASEMVDSRPFASAEALLRVAGTLWSEFDEDDWREAFGAHPRIGESTLGDDTHSRWSSAEQAGTHDATEATLAALRQANDQYEDRFGHVFLICASGRTADEMLSALGHRLKNEPEHEVKIAAEEQGKITLLRLRKLLAP